jgi:signal transduction histidine kinase
MPSPGSASPALSDAVLRETLDLLGQVVASMSARLDQHGQALAEVQEAAVQSRDAAQGAKAYTDPQRYGRHIGQEIDKALGTILNRLEALQSGFAADRQETRRRLEELARQEEHALQRLRDNLADAGRWKKRIPFIALFGLVLVLGLTIALPRFVAGNSTACAVLGGDWIRCPESEKLACVFYAE